MLSAGRGFGKTRTGGEAVREAVKRGYGRMAFIGATSADVRDVMVEGESGILAISSPHDMPNYEPSKRRLTWPNGAVATTFSADEPERLRGPQFDFAWCDELAAWRYGGAWDMLMFGLRLGYPRLVVTTTPKPTKLYRKVAATSNAVIVRGSSYENRANLSEVFFQQVIRPYEGTRLGRQEINAEELTDTPGALWKDTLIDQYRVTEYPTLKRIAIGVDPAVTSGNESDETGVIVAGIGMDGHAYILDDKSLRDTPARWAAAVVKAYREHRADRIVAEGNNGGDLVENTIRTVEGGTNISYLKVHASRGKIPRAEPVSSLYERGLVHHVGYFADLESQMCTYVPGQDSPDRMDALVWVLSFLMVEQMGRASGGIHI